MINLPYISKLFNKTKSFSNPNTASLYPNTKWKKILLGFFLCALTFTSLYFSAPTILSFLLVHKTPLETADVILVSGTGQSLDTAIRLYREGIVTRFLITETIPDRYRGLNKPISVHYFIHRQLAEAGIPENKIACFKKTIHDPVKKQLRLRRWIMKNHIRSYMCMPELYSTRYEKMIHDQTFPEGTVKILFYLSEGKQLLRKKVIAIQNTLIRFVYWNWVHADALHKALS